HLVYHLLNVGYCLGNILEQLLHFLRGLKVIFLIGKAISVTATTTYGSGLFFTVLYTKKDIMGMCVLLFQIIGIVGGHQFHIMLLGKLDQYLVYTVLILLTVTHNFDIQVLPKSLFPP